MQAEVLYLFVSSVPYTSAANEPVLHQFSFLENPATGESVDIITTIQAHWTKLVDLLWLRPHTVDNLKAQPNYNPRDACREVLDMWLKGDERDVLTPRNWETVIKVMGRLGNAKLGQDIRKALTGE